MEKFQQGGCSFSDLIVSNENISRRIQTFLRETKGCTKLDHIWDEDMRNELQIYSLHGKIQQYRNCVNPTRLPKLDYSQDEDIRNKYCRYIPNMGKSNNIKTTLKPCRPNKTSYVYQCCILLSCLIITSFCLIIRHFLHITDEYWCPA